MCRYLIVFVCIVFCSTSVACRHTTRKSLRLGQFTAASSNNVRGLKYKIADGTKARVEGKSCFSDGVKDDRLQRAMDNAIQNGQAQGIDGDLLVNVRISEENTSSSVPFCAFLDKRDNCIIVEGDLVKIQK